MRLSWLILYDKRMKGYFNQTQIEKLLKIKRLKVYQNVFLGYSKAYNVFSLN